MKFGRQPQTSKACILLGALAAFGWIGMAYGAWSFIKIDDDRRSELAKLHALISDQRNRIESADELSKLHADIAKGRNEYLRLAQDVGAAQDRLRAIRIETEQARNALNDAVGALSGRRDQAGRGTSIEARDLTSPETIAAAQRALTGLGYGPLEIDGAMGPQTREALQRFERDRRMVVTGDLNPRTADALGLGG